MQRFTVSLAVVAVLLGGMIATIGGSATAQDVAMEEHPIVGGWELENEGFGSTSTSYAVFHPDGTYVEAGTDGGTIIGVWQATGERTAGLTFFAADLDLDPDVTILGEGRQTVEVGETGNAFTAQGRFEGRDPDGAVLFGDDVRSLGNRLEVAPVEEMGASAATPAP